MYLDMKTRVTQLDLDVRFIIQNKCWGPEFNQKKVEIRQLKAELAKLSQEVSMIRL